MMGNVPAVAWRRKLFLGLWLAVAIAVALTVARLTRRSGPDESPDSRADGAKAEITLHRREADQPDIGVTEDHRLARVRHKDAKGLSPHESVVTPEGMVTIRRTFDAEGKLLEEVAERDGKRVPVPEIPGGG